MSCYREDSFDAMQTSTTKNETRLSTLVDNLQALNDSLLYIQNPDTKGIWKRILRFCAIAGADAAGAYEVGKIGAAVGSLAGPEGAIIGAGIGGLIGGAGASYAVYCSTKANTEILHPQVVASAYIALRESNIDLSKHCLNQIKIKLPESKRTLQEIGAKHNIVLNKLLNQEFSSYSETDVLTPMEVKIIKSKEFETGYYSILESYVVNGHGTYVGDDGSIGNKVMKLYLEILNRYPNKVNDIEFISNKYIELISKSSELSEEEKDLLYSALCVSVYSFEYWEKELS